MNFIRLPLLPAFLTLVVIAAIAIFGGGDLAEVPQSNAHSVLSEALATFGMLYPLWAKIISFLAILTAGVCLGRMANRYNLYSGNCYLPMPLFGLIICGVFPDSASLTRYVVALFLAWATFRFCCSLRNGYSFGDLFRASLLTGLMPLLEVPMIGCVLIVPVALAVFKRTAREVVVALFGLFVPLFALCYVTWATGGEFLTPISSFCQALMDYSNPSLFAFDLGSALFLGSVMLLTLGALLIHATGFYVLQQKGRMVVLFYILLLALVAVLWLIPSASMSTLALVAIPSSILLPIFFVRIRLLAAAPLYLLLVLLGLGSMFFL